MIFVKDNENDSDGQEEQKLNPNTMSSRNILD